VESPSNEIVWAFDLGKGSIGEAVRRGNEFLHKASLLIPAEFAGTKTAAGRRRMWRTRQAHKYTNQLIESQTLTVLRNALLPRLLSGELRVPPPSNGADYSVVKT
jgi:hypothetical protein